MNFTKNRIELEEDGYSISSGVYTVDEIKKIEDCIESATKTNSTFYKSKDLFAIRQLMNNIPDLYKLVYNENIKTLLKELLGDQYFLTKGIYFDKPAGSNWFVSYHQDISISVSEKYKIDNYNNWTFKKGQYGVQPPVEILEDTVTLRIHLDDTNKYNGALKVIPKSHTHGIMRVEDVEKDNEVVCDVDKGGVMLMKPLTFHASNRTTNQKRRRVIHLEFNTLNLAPPMKWLEYNKSLTCTV